MRPLIEAIPTGHGPESIVAQLLASGPAPDGPSPKVVLLRTGQFESPAARYSLVTAWPFLLFRSFGSQCEIETCGGPAGTRLVSRTHFGNPWHLLDALMSRFELLDEVDSPFPLGGAFGYWGYDLKNFIEPKLPRRAASDLPLPDCHVGFYDSVVVFDHRLGKVTVIATGLDADGSRSAAKAGARLEFWKRELLKAPGRSELGNLTPATATSPLARNVQSGSVDPTMLSAKGSWPGAIAPGQGRARPPTSLAATSSRWSNARKSTFVPAIFTKSISRTASRRRPHLPAGNFSRDSRRFHPLRSPPIWKGMPETSADVSKSRLRRRSNFSA